MSELLSKEVEVIITARLREFETIRNSIGHATVGGAVNCKRLCERALTETARSVLFLAATEICEYCKAGDIPSPLETSLFHPVSLDGESIAECAAAPIHKMLRGEK